MLKLIKSNKINFLSLLLIIISFLNLFFIIKNNFYKYTEKFDPKKYELKYNNSQYVIPKSKNPISDAELYAYAGYRYIKGLNPILINSEHPPLGKYIIGLFIILTNRVSIVSLFFGLLNLVFIFLIIFKITKSYFFSSLGLFFLSFNTIFTDLIIYAPLLDIIQSFFVLSYFYILIFWLKNKKNIYLLFLGINLGIIASIKFYLPTILLFITTSFFLLLIKEIKYLKKIVLIIPISIITYISTYFKFFLSGNNFIDFLKSQKWIFNFWRFNSLNEANIKGNFLDLILFNKWHVWWGNQKIINYENWNIFWSLSFLLGVIFSSFYIIKTIKNLLLNKKNNNLDIWILLFSLWIINFCFYIYFIPIYPRYLILLYPSIYIVIVLFFAKILIKQYV
ncbi:MAG: hypothetical protein N2Z85_00490 [Patescibacteria group bacterium]|nr:hypothetical protein [Patescibacteria group bacterium]